MDGNGISLVGGRYALAAGLLFMSLCGAAAHGAEAVYGPFGPEGARLREQLWIVPGGDPKVPLRATVFRPDHISRTNSSAAPARWPLVVINHGTEEATRDAVAMPIFYWLSRWFVERGYVVLLPQRRGHGATGGELAGGRDRCANPDHHRAGLDAADDIAAAVRYMSAQPFIEPSQTVVAGVSTGGWAALALAARNPPGVRFVVNFAGGRGGHAYGLPHAVCAPDRLVEAAAAFGRTARIPTLWLYAQNDSYFGPELASAMASAWRDAGGTSELRLLPAYGVEGHAVVDDRAGWQLWGRDLERFVAGHRDLGQPPDARVSDLR